MDLESVIQSEISQKEKNVEIKENGTDEPICRARIEPQVKSADVWAQVGEKLLLLLLLLLSHVSRVQLCATP